MKPDGRLDRAFDGDRRTRSGVPGRIKLFPKGSHLTYSYVSGVKPMGSGRILLGGGWGGRPMAARLKNDGGLDKSFGKSGIATVDLDGRRGCRCSDVFAMTRDHHGRILIAGSRFKLGNGGMPEDRQLVLARLGSGGKPDSSFGNHGIVQRNFDGSVWKGGGIAVQRNGRIVVAGRLGWDLTLLRFLPDGSRDISFFGGKLSPASLTGYSGITSDVIVDHSGRIVAAGGGSDVHGNDEVQLVRILPQ